ncbi:DUF3606 domain-containing protein [Oxalobacteraceae bacterium A2-2]
MEMLKDDPALAGQYAGQPVINTRERGALDYWASEFDVSVHTLMGVIREVGPLVKEVRRCFSF